jgi:LmbE family N-acetylglucosaminyl deacetylase
MPTDRAAAPGGAALFLFAHQDDEFGIYGELAAERSAGAEVHCVYLTDGAGRRDVAARRNAESLAVLADLGIAPAAVAFLGFPDGALHAGMERAARALASLPCLPVVGRLYLPAWEGGHQDHDATHLLGLWLAARLGRLEHTSQFPLYHGAGLAGPLFRVFSPLPANGPVRRRRLPLSDRLRYGAWPLRYRSQWASFAGLWPPAFAKLLAGGGFALQPVSLQRAFERPHAGPLLYERRSDVTYADLSSAARALLGAIGRTH